MPPDHVVGVRTQPGDVVHAANHDILGFELVKQLLDLRSDGLALVREAIGVRASAEHRPHGVPDDVVEITRSWPGANPQVRGTPGYSGVLLIAHRFSLMCPPRATPRSWFRTRSQEGWRDRRGSTRLPAEPLRCRPQRRRRHRP